MLAPVATQTHNTHTVSTQASNMNSDEDLTTEKKEYNQSSVYKRV